MHLTAAPTIDSARGFPAFNLERLLTTCFRPRLGEKLCILIDLPDIDQIMDFAFCDEPIVYDKNDTDFDQDVDFDSNEWLLSFFSSTESTQNQATFLNGKMKDTTYHCSDTNAWDTDMISCLEAV